MAAWPELLTCRRGTAIERRQRSCCSPDSFHIDEGDYAYITRMGKMQIISTIAMISINETLIIQLISFLVFLFIINRIMIQPLRNVSKEREAHIQKIELDTATAEKKVEQVVKQIKKQEAKAFDAAHEIREKIEESGRIEADDIIHDALREVESLSMENHRHVSAMVEEARKSIRKEAETLAVGMMEKLLDRRLSL
jgi:F-type H+-transporting ATPase subunit b